MLAKFGIFEDSNCNIPLSYLGTIDIGDTKEIPFFVGNTGDTTIIDLEIQNEFEDVETNIKFPLKLSPGEIVEGNLIWKPRVSINEGTNSGSITIIGRSIGNPNAV